MMGSIQIFQINVQNKESPDPHLVPKELLEAKKVQDFIINTSFTR